MVDSIGPRRILPIRALALVAALGALGIAPPVARADLMRYQFSGEAYAPGSTTAVPFSGSFAYDPTEATSMTNTSAGYKSTAYGNYWNVPGTAADASGLTLNLGGKSLISETGGLGVAVYQPTGTGQPSTGLSVTSTLGQPLQATLQFSNPTQAVFSSLAPPSTINPADFSGISLMVYGNNTSGTASTQSLLYSGQITSILPPAAPEPSTVALLGLGAFAYYLRARSGRRAS